MGISCMRTLIIFLFFICYAFPQGMYLPNVNSISLNFLYGQYGYKDDRKISFTATYTVLGVVDLNYSRSTVLTENDISNFQNEYYVRGYLFKENIFFISGTVGYQYQESEDELWNNFPINYKSEGFFLEGGIHLATTHKENNKIVISVFYKHYNPIEEIRTSTTLIRNPISSRTFTFDLAVIHYFGQVGIEIGPKLVLEKDFNYPFIGLDLSLMAMH